MYLQCRQQVEQRQEIQSTAICAYQILACCGIMDPLSPDPESGDWPAGNTADLIHRDACAFCDEFVLK